MAEDAFGSFEDIVEKDDMLDVNAILGGAPPPTPQEDKKEEDNEEDKNTPKEKEEPLLDVNSALQGIKDLVEDKESEDPEDKEDDTKKTEDIVEDDTEDSTPDHKETDDTPSSSDAPFAIIFARDLSGRGLLSEFDEDEFKSTVDEHGEAEALRQLIQKEVTTNVEAAKTDFDEGYQQYLGLLGKGVPQEQAD
jgi:hypothetical protein